MQYVHIVQLLGRRVAVCASLQAAIEHAPALIADAWREVSPGRWSPAVSRHNRFSGFEIVREDLHGEFVVAGPTSIVANLLALKPRFEVKIGSIIGCLESVALSTGYRVDILAAEGGTRAYQATDGAWVSKPAPNADAAILAAAQHERGLLARVATSEALLRSRRRRRLPSCRPSRRRLGSSRWTNSESA